MNKFLYNFSLRDKLIYTFKVLLLLCFIICFICFFLPMVTFEIIYYYNSSTGYQTIVGTMDISIINFIFRSYNYSEYLSISVSFFMTGLGFIILIIFNLVSMFFLSSDLAKYDTRVTIGKSIAFIIIELVLGIICLVPQMDINPIGDIVNFELYYIYYLVSAGITVGVIYLIMATINLGIILIQIYLPIKDFDILKNEATELGEEVSEIIEANKDNVL